MNTPMKYSEYVETYSKELESYKNFAVGRRNRRKYTQEGMYKYLEQLQDYVTEQRQQRRPLTIAGVLLALGTNKDFWSKAKNGEYDFLLEEVLDKYTVTDDNIVEFNGVPCLETDNGRIPLISYSDFYEKTWLLIQNQLEENCYTNKGNPAGSIFGLKAQFDWREDNTPQHLVQNLVIADSEQAKEAMQMLKLLDT